jgi:histidine triad (HIT) family protein
MSGCVFCRIVAGHIPSSAVFEDEHAYAFMDGSAAKMTPAP